MFKLKTKGIGIKYFLQNLAQLFNKLSDSFKTKLTFEITFDIQSFLNNI